MLATYAKQYYEKFGFNVLPVQEKRPIIPWEPWQSAAQTDEEISQFKWEKATGIGGVMGINNIRCIDIDAIENTDLISQILSYLGLPEKYSWVIQSGSGQGYHIYFRCLINDSCIELLNEIGGQKAVYKFHMKTEGTCDHLEFRVRNCQTLLPPSYHPSGGVYNFVNNDPTESPQIVELELVIKYLQEHCFIEKRSSIENNDKISVPVIKAKNNFDEDMLYDAALHIGKNLPSGSYDEWLKCGFACASLGESGYKYFALLSKSNPNYSDTESEIKKKFDDLLKDYDGRITLGTLYRIAEIYGWRRPFLRFWEFDQKGKIKIIRYKFIKFLEREGFFKIKKDGHCLFVKSDQNIVEEFDPIFVKDFVRSLLKEVSIENFAGTNRAEVIDTLMKGVGQFFAQSFFEFLITKEIEFQRDTKDIGYLYFKNCVVEVSKDSIKQLQYRHLDKYIWRRQIIDGEFNSTSAHTDFEDFQFNITNKDPERFRALKSGIGYLLHTYKDPNQAKAVVFIDEKLGEGASGRSGKGLVIKAIGKIRNIITEDGRNFDIGKNFAFQRVSADTDIVSIEDLKERFPFDKLFSILTEGITIEKKNKDEMYIPFSESPKVVVSTNYSIKGIDDSSFDRQFLIEFSGHYHRFNRPIDEFGKLFFEGWNKDEWNTFYNYMISCLQFYLANGLMLYKYVNIERKRLVDETSQEFAEFSDSLKLNHPYDKKVLFDQFMVEYPEVEKVTQAKFTRWIKLYARIKSVEVAENRSNSIRMIELKGMKEAARVA